MSFGNLSIIVREPPTTVRVHDNGLTAIPVGEANFLFDRPADARAWLEGALAALDKAEGSRD